jgi:hypothetical protein
MTVGAMHMIQRFTFMPAKKTATQQQKRKNYFVSRLAVVVGVLCGK